MSASVHSNAMKRPFISIPHRGDLFTSYLRVFHTDRADEWDITSINIYADEAQTVLIVDDVRMHELPADAQDKIIAALNVALTSYRREFYAKRTARNLQGQLNSIMNAAGVR